MYKRSTTSPLFTRGYLSYLAEKRMRGEDLTPKEKLNTDQLIRIATKLGHLAKDYDLYELLFESEPTTLEVDGTEIYTPDLTLFVLLDWTHQRGYFMQYQSGATSDTKMARSVPLALEGARRVFNKSYMSWLDKNNPTRCDIFLPKGLTSHGPAEGGGFEVLPKGSRGLLVMRKHLSDVEITPEVIWELRDILGPQWASKRQPRLLKKSEFKQLPDNLGLVWNNIDHLCRCMLAQTWIYKYPSRNSNMITDFMDWDNYNPGLDSEGNALKGLKPKDTLPDGILAMTKFKIKDIEKYEPEGTKKQILPPAKSGDDLSL